LFLVACRDLLLDRVVADADHSEPRRVLLTRDALDRLIAWRLGHDDSLTKPLDAHEGHWKLFTRSAVATESGY
jgi:hypothetical protein